MKIIDNCLLLILLYMIFTSEVITSIKKKHNKNIILEANSDDIYELKQFIYNIFKYEREDIYFKNRLKKEFGRIYILRETTNNKLIGAIILSYDRHQFYIDTLGIDKQYRNKGLGAKLMKHAINSIINEFTYCINGNKLYFSLHVLTTNKDAIKLYKEMNFKVKKMIPKLYKYNPEIDPNNSDGYYMIYIPPNNNNCKTELFDYEYWKLS